MRGQKGGRELLEKRRGTSASLYLAKGPGWQMMSGATMPDAAGGEGVTGWLNRKG